MSVWKRRVLRHLWLQQYHGVEKAIVCIKRFQRKERAYRLTMLTNQWLESVGHLPGTCWCANGFLRPCLHSLNNIRKVDAVM